MEGREGTGVGTSPELLAGPRTVLTDPMESLETLELERPIRVVPRLAKMARPGLYIPASPVFGCGAMWKGA